MRCLLGVVGLLVVLLGLGSWWDLQLIKLDFIRVVENDLSRFSDVPPGEGSFPTLSDRVLVERILGQYRGLQLTRQRQTICSLATVAVGAALLLTTIVLAARGRRGAPHPSD